MLMLLSAITFSDKAGSFALFLPQNDRLRGLRKVQVGKFAYNGTKRLRELSLRTRSACFVSVTAINKPDFMAGISFFHVSAIFPTSILNLSIR